MPILTASEDKLRADKLKGDPLVDGYDPLGKLESRRVKTYDKEFGFALHPEQKEAALQYQGNINKAVGTQESSLAKYKTDFTTGMAEADKRAFGILSQIQPPTMDLVTIRVMNGSTIENEYRVPRAVAEGIAQEKKLASAWFGDNYFNVDVTPIGSSDAYGKELHEALGDAAAQTAEYLKTGTEIAEDQYNAAKESIESERKIATDRFNFNVEAATTVINATKTLWTGFLADQQQAFIEGQARNTGGIADLLKSGALKVKK